VSQTQLAVKASAASPELASNLAPQLALSRSNIIVALPVGGMASEGLRISNTGSAPLTADLHVSGTNVGALSTSHAAAYNLLVMTPSTARLDGLCAALNELNDVAYAVWDPASGVPTVDNLLLYDVVLVGNSSQWESAGIAPNTLGNVLAEYIDLGGKVIDSLLVHAQNEAGLAGRYINEGYAPLMPATGLVARHLQVEVLDASHPLMDGFTSMATDRALDVKERGGAVVPAIYAGTSIPYVAANNNVVAINQQLCDSDWGSGSLSTLIGAAVRWLCGARPPWLSLPIDRISLTPGESVDIDVSVDLSHTRTTAVYRGQIEITSDDPATPFVNIPVEAAALNDLAMGRIGGTVSSDRPGSSLSGVEVGLQAAEGASSTRITDGHGAYSFWVTPGTYTLVVSVAGYTPYSSTIEVAPEGRLLIDIHLVMDAPWFRIKPERLAATKAQAFAVEIANDGPRPLDYTFAVADLPAWASVEPTRGSIGPGASTAVVVRLDPAAATPGWNVARLALATNDPWQAPGELLLYCRSGHAVFAPVACR